MAPRVALALVGLGLAAACTSRGNPAAPTTRAWPLPDASCQPRSEHACGARERDDACAERQAARWGALTVARWRERSAQGRWPHDFEALTIVAQRERAAVPDDVRSDPDPRALMPTRAMRAEIERIEQTNPAAVLDAAIALRTSDELTAPMLASLADPTTTAMRLTGALACELPERGFLYPIGRLQDPRPLQQTAQWPAWRMQLRVIEMLRERDAVGDRAVLDTLARDHWSKLVRTVAAEGPAVLEAPAATWDHGVGRCDAVPDTLAVGGERVALAPVPAPLPDTAALPNAAVVLDGEVVDLRAAATAAAPLGASWLVGVHRGEFEGGLFLVTPDGRTPVRLGDAPVLAIVDDGMGLVVLAGQDHLGADEGRVLALDLGSDGTPALRHLLELPDVPRAAAVTADHTLVTATERGVIVRAPDGTITLLPCA